MVDPIQSATTKKIASASGAEAPSADFKSHLERLRGDRAQEGGLDAGLRQLGGIGSELRGLEREIAQLVQQMKTHGDPNAGRLIELQLKVQKLGVSLEMASKVVETGTGNLRQMLNQHV